SAPNPFRKGVEADYREDGDRPQAVDIGPVTRRCSRQLPVAPARGPRFSRNRDDIADQRAIPSRSCILPTIACRGRGNIDELAEVSGDMENCTSGDMRKCTTCE